MRSIRTVLVALLTAAAAFALASPVLAQWPTTCVDLNDIVEAHLGNDNNVAIYQRVFGDQAEQACQNDHRKDVRGVFAWAFDEGGGIEGTDLPDLAWPTDCVELNDIVEAHLGNANNVEIYQRVFGDQAEPACRNDHRGDVRGVFGWAFGRTTPQPERLAFQSSRNGNFELFVMNADGSGVTQLTGHGGHDLGPVWSPDGRRIAFFSDRDGDRWLENESMEIYVVNADGTGLIQLTDNASIDKDVAWSPDGRRLAFMSDRDGNREIYVMSADGSDVVRLTNDAASDFQPAWSPDGRLLAFASDRDGDEEIYVMSADGTNMTQLTHNTHRDGAPVWSPNGAGLAFHSTRDGDGEVYVMNADGTGVVQLTSNTHLDVHPDWAPDGSRLAFVSDRDGDAEIYVMNADGTAVTRLTDSQGLDVSPAWSPESAKS